MKRREFMSGVVGTAVLMFAGLWVCQTPPLQEPLAASDDQFVNLTSPEEFNKAALAKLSELSEANVATMLEIIKTQDLLLRKLAADIAKLSKECK